MSAAVSPSAYPLAWPHNRPRHGARKAPSQFKTSLAGAMNNVQDSLRRFGADSGKKLHSIIISSNVSLGVNNPEESGVAVYFTWDDEQVCIAVDRYSKVQFNLQAIHHIIEARRTELRHGGLHIAKASFAGFKALPAPRSYRNPWDVLQIQPGASAGEIKAARNNLARLHHADTGASGDKMADINAAYDAAMAESG